MKTFNVTGNVRYKFQATVQAADELHALDEVKELSEAHRLKLGDPVGIPNVKITSEASQETEEN